MRKSVRRLEEVLNLGQVIFCCCSAPASLRWNPPRPFIAPQLKLLSGDRHNLLNDGNWAVSRHSEAVFFLPNIGEATEYPKKENP